MVSRIKDINRHIGTGYYPALNRLIEHKAREEIAELEQDNYVIDDNKIKERVNKRAREIEIQLTMHWYKQLKPFSHYDRFNNSINTAYIETTNNTDNNHQIPSTENDMPNYYSDSIDGIGERIAELHRNIAILKRTGETR